MTDCEGFLTKEKYKPALKTGKTPVVVYKCIIQKQN